MSTQDTKHSSWSFVDLTPYLNGKPPSKEWKSPADYDIGPDEQEEVNLAFLKAQGPNYTPPTDHSWLYDIEAWVEDLVAAGPDEFYKHLPFKHPDYVDPETQAVLARSEGYEKGLQAGLERHDNYLAGKWSALEEVNEAFDSNLHIIGDGSVKGTIPGVIRGLPEKVAEELNRLRARKQAQEIFAQENSVRTDPPPLVNLETFLAEPDQETVYAVKPLLPDNGRAVFVGKAKNGKSTVVGNLVRSLADGTPFLDQFDVLPAKRVLVLDNELSEGMLRRWLRTQGIKHPERIEVVSLRGKLTSFNILDEQTRSQWAEKLGPADWIIFDGMAPALSVLGLDEWKQATAFLNAFDELTTQAGIRNTIVVHHAGHGADRARGDSGILGWPDALWTLTKDQDGDADENTAARYLTAFGRDVDLPATLLEYDPITKHLAAVPGTKKERKQAALLTEILTYLDDGPGSSSPPKKSDVEKEFATVRHYPRTQVRDALQDAQARGFVAIERGTSNAHHLTITPFGRQFASSPQFASPAVLTGPSSSPVRHTPIGVANCELNPEPANTQHKQVSKQEGSKPQNTEGSAPAKRDESKYLDCRECHTPKLRYELTNGLCQKCADRGELPA